MRDGPDLEASGPGSGGMRLRIGLLWGLPISAVLWIALIWFAYQFWAERHAEANKLDRGAQHPGQGEQDGALVTPARVLAVAERRERLAGHQQP